MEQKISIKLENNFDYNIRLLDDLEQVLSNHTGSGIHIKSIDNNGDHWLYVTIRVLESMKQSDDYIRSVMDHLRGITIGFLEANRITCI
jgi:hypothetical protein